LEFSKQLLFIVLVEEWIAQTDFSDDAARTPHVDFELVLPLAEQQFRCALPKSHHLLCLVFLEFGAQLAGQAEVGQLERALRVDEQVGQFEVAMHDVARVQLLESKEQLQHQTLDLLGFHRDMLEVAELQHAAQVELALLEYQEEVRLVLVLLFWLRVHHFNQLHHLLVVQPLQDLYLT